MLAAQPPEPAPRGPAPLQQKAIDCLKVAATQEKSAERGHLYREACDRWQTKPVLRKFEELQERGYLRYHVHPITAVLTLKGKVALEQWQSWRDSLQRGMDRLQGEAVRGPELL